MSGSASKRRFAVVVAVLAFVSYLGMRDTVQVKGDVPRKDVKAVVAGVEEWSSPKLFRHIEVSRGPHREDNLLIAQVREPGYRWSITVFTNYAGAWRKCAWFLCEEDRASLNDFIQHYNK